MTTIQATLGGLTFSTAHGTKYTIRQLAGWYGPPPEKTQLIERPNADGAFGQQKFYRSARPITLSGLVLGDGDEGFNDWLALSALMSSGEPATLTVTDPAGTQSALVKMFGVSSLDPLINGMADFQFSLVAFDPVKYGPVRELSTGLTVPGGGLEYPLHDPDGALFYGDVGELGRVTLTNNGTAKTFPTVRVTGGIAAGFFIQRLDTGDVVRYDRVVPLGTDVQIDMRTGAVLVDGTSDGSTSLSRAEFFGVEAGASVEVQFNALGEPSGTPLMTVQFRDGYW